MSNLVHRRRRCARIVLYTILLPGGQYATGQVRSLHQAKDIVVAPGAPILYCQRQLFCFVGFLSANRADQSDVEGQTGKLAYLSEHTHQTARA